MEAKMIHDPVMAATMLVAVFGPLLGMLAICVIQIIRDVREA